MYKDCKFSDMQIVEHLDSTHEGTTEVYLVRLHSELMVCKAMSKSGFKDQTSIQHVHNEKQALNHFTSIKHPRINHILGTLQDQENIYLVLEMVEGLPLHKLLQMVGKFTEKLTKLVITQVGLIMLDFHTEGFVYRDIKASNFMLSLSGRVTLIDLGKAKKIGKERTNTICGTTHSMPPEVYDKKGYSYEFDYYGFGVLLYELLTGRPPFGYANANQNIIADIKHGLTQEIISKVDNPTAADLIQKLLAPAEGRFGLKGGFEEILSHPYFAEHEFLQIKDIYDQNQAIDAKSDDYKLYVSDIEDFGISKDKYQSLENDIFKQIF